MTDSNKDKIPFCKKVSQKKKILPKDLPKGSLENGCLIIDDSVTDEDLEKIRLRD